jgi:arginine repressor
MLALIEHTPDIYLDEIQEGLYTQHDIDVSLATISRTLHRLGISSKKVCSFAVYLTLYSVLREGSRSCLDKQPNGVNMLVEIFSWRLVPNRPNESSALMNRP